MNNLKVGERDQLLNRLYGHLRTLRDSFANSIYSAFEEAPSDEIHNGALAAANTDKTSSKTMMIPNGSNSN
jgi:hypothetical protein